MNKEIYAFDRSATGHGFTFISIGPSGKIPKIVLISPIQNILPTLGDVSVYNLAFGDLKMINGNWQMDDSVRTNNRDMSKVLATVFNIALSFMEDNSRVALIFEGYMDSKSTELGRNQRNILYQRAINSNWNELSSAFSIWGIIKNHREQYVPGQNYDSILITN